jgi:hypothetical protein
MLNLFWNIIEILFTFISIDLKIFFEDLLDRPYIYCKKMSILTSFSYLFVVSASLWTESVIKVNDLYCNERMERQEWRFRVGECDSRLNCRLTRKNLKVFLLFLDLLNKIPFIRCSVVYIIYVQSTIFSDLNGPK